MQIVILFASWKPSHMKNWSLHFSLQWKGSKSRPAFSELLAYSTHCRDYLQAFFTCMQMFNHFLALQTSRSMGKNVNESTNELNLCTLQMKNRGIQQVLSKIQRQITAKHLRCAQLCIYGYQGCNQVSNFWIGLCQLVKTAPHKLLVGWQHGDVIHIRKFHIRKTQYTVTSVFSTHVPSAMPAVSCLTSPLEWHRTPVGLVLHLLCHGATGLHGKASDDQIISTQQCFSFTLPFKTGKHW